MPRLTKEERAKEKMLYAELNELKNKEFLTLAEEKRHEELRLHLYKLKPLS